MIDKIECCPHCGSKSGFMTLTDYINVPYKRGFDELPLDNSEMYDNVSRFKQHRYVYCVECEKPICTTKEIGKQLHIDI